MLSGELAPSAGSVRFAGHDVTRWSQPRRARAGLGRSYQRTTIFAEFSVLENCRLAAQASEPRPWLVWERAADDARGIAIATRALAAAGLDGDAGRIASTLSHGAKRQLEIAMCLATAPRALLLDEPLAGMGAEETGRMLALLVRPEGDARDPARRARHGRGLPRRRPDHGDGQRPGDRERRSRAHPQRSARCALAYLGDAH